MAVFQADSFQGDSFGPNPPGGPFGPVTGGKGLTVQTYDTDATQWGAGNPAVDLNTRWIGGMDTILAGMSTFSVASGTYSAIFPTDIWNCMWRITGALTGAVTIEPSFGQAANHFHGFYFYENLTTGSFTVTVQSSDGALVLPQSTRGIFYVVSGDQPRMMSQGGIANFTAFPIGSTRAWFQATAPTGWQQVTAPLTTSGMMQTITDGTGGATGGTVAFSTIFARTATDLYTLQIADIPSHNHTFVSSSTSCNFTNVQGAVNEFFSFDNLDITQTAPAGSGGAHSHNVNLQVMYSNWMVATYTG